MERSSGGVQVATGSRLATQDEAPGIGKLRRKAPGRAEPGLAGPSVAELLDEAPRSRFHNRAVIVSGMGFFTDAYDLFVISTVAVLVKSQWGLSSAEASWVAGSAILGAFIGAVVFGRIADLLGRKSVYLAVAVIMVVGALASACSPGFVWLVVARFVLGLGIGGDYPVSAVLMSEYANRADRGRMVGLVFSMQALGLIVGPLVGIALLSSGLDHDTTWRIMLGLGAIPAGAVIYLRSRMPESPRFKAQVQGQSLRAARSLSTFSGGLITLPGAQEGNRYHVAQDAGPASRLAMRTFLADPRMRRLIVATAGSWFLFDYAYYGNTLSLPAILKGVDPHATLVAKLLWTLGLFVVFALPGYLLAVARMDRIGHRRLQIIGFTVMACAFAALGAIGGLTTVVPLFLLVFGLSYFFVEFGPNTTTFVLPSEVFPVDVRTTGHGIAAGVGKLGAFIGVFLVPWLQKGIGLRGMLGVAAAASVLGLLVTLLLKEPAKRSLEEIALDGEPSEATGFDNRVLEFPTIDALDVEELAPLHEAADLH